MRSMKRKSTISRIFPSQPTQRRPFCKTTVALAPPIVTTRNEDAAERMSDLEWNPLFLPSSSVVSGLRWPCRDRAVSSALPFRPCNLWSAIFAPHLGQLCQRRWKTSPSYFYHSKNPRASAFIPPRRQNSIGDSRSIRHRLYAFHLGHFPLLAGSRPRVSRQFWWGRRDESLDAERRIMILERCFTMLYKDSGYYFETMEYYSSPKILAFSSIETSSQIGLLIRSRNRSEFSLVDRKTLVARDTF